jgi:hypothetical protein
VGKTVPSYRWALEDELAKWRSFRNALQTQNEREAFDELIDMCRGNSSASGAACNPIIFEPMIMSILIAQTKKMQELQCQLNEVLWQKICQTTKTKIATHEQQMETQNPN